MWSEAGAQLALEKSLGVGGFGYPAIVALNPKKERLATLKDSLTKDNFVDFLERLLEGYEKTFQLEGLLPQSLSSVVEWDGKDAQIVSEEEFSLEDIMG